MKKLSVLFLIFVFTSSSAFASIFHSNMFDSSMFSIEHGAQGTGNYKGKRDRHEKPKPQHEKKKKKAGWFSR